MRVQYRYNTQIKFEFPIKKHFFRIFDIIGNECQLLSWATCDIKGSKEIDNYVDSYGNRIIYGKMLEEHDTFDVVYRGEVVLATYYLHELVDQRFLLPFGATLGGIECENVFQLAKSRIEKFSGDIKSITFEFMKTIHERCIYEKNRTSLKTTAEVFCGLKRGVCQDFSNLLIVLLRKKGIHARYVAGLVVGEGETHAWVEVYDGDGWFGADPTRNMFIETGYIKICHGRDSTECALNRGVFQGSADQTLNIDVSVKQ